MMRGAGLGAALVAAMLNMRRRGGGSMRVFGGPDREWDAHIERRINARRRALSGKPWRRNVLRARRAGR